MEAFLAIIAWYSKFPPADVIRLSLLMSDVLKDQIRAMKQQLTQNHPPHHPIGRLELWANFHSHQSQSHVALFD